MDLLSHVDRKLTIPAPDPQTCLYLILRLIRISVLLINASPALYSEIGVARKNKDHLSSRYTRWDHSTQASPTYYSTQSERFQTDFYRRTPSNGSSVCLVKSHQFFWENIYLQAHRAPIILWPSLPSVCIFSGDKKVFNLSENDCSSAPDWTVCLKLTKFFSIWWDIQ